MKIKISAFALLAIFGLSAFTYAKREDLFEVTKNLEIFASAYKELSLGYVDETKPGELVTKALEAMLASLDPYTVYIPESRIEDFRIENTGEYGGIGASLYKLNDIVYISDILSQSPLLQANIADGDILLEADGRSIEGRSIAEITKLVQGQANTSIKIKTKSFISGEIKEQLIDRINVKVPDVPYYGMLDDQGTGYITLSSFTSTASNEVKKAFESLKDSGMTSLVFDLRGNGGGLLIQAVNIVNFFVPKGITVVETKGKLLSYNHTYKTTNNPLDTIMPICVLVNENSASASEIVSGALQDLDRAVIVGTETYGKGLVQRTVDLPYKAKLKLTISKYYIPSGRCIQKLDYSEKNALGEVLEVPDSLLRTFTTKNGRVVKDGRGIKPDVFIDKPFAGEIISAMGSNGAFFLWGNTYLKSGKTISDPATFELSDADFKDFISFAEGMDIQYKNQSEEILNILTEISESERLAKFIEQDIKNLQDKVKPDVKRDLTRFSDQAKKYLEVELAKKMFFEKGQTLALLHNDVTLDSALELLRDSSRYSSILKK
jgi:carboxyl-terminal processing protease